MLRAAHCMLCNFMSIVGHRCPFQGLTNVLEFPLSLAATLPAQMPNWDILSDLTTSLGKMKRSPIQVSTSHIRRGKESRFSVYVYMFEGLAVYGNSAVYHLGYTLNCMLEYLIREVRTRQSTPTMENCLISLKAVLISYICNVSLVQARQTAP